MNLIQSNKFQENAESKRLIMTATIINFLSSWFENELLIYVVTSDRQDT